MGSSRKKDAIYRKRASTAGTPIPQRSILEYRSLLIKGFSSLFSIMSLSTQKSTSALIFCHVWHDDTSQLVCQRKPVGVEDVTV
jgi:hypothetical protein